MANQNLVNSYLMQVSSLLPERELFALRTQLEEMEDSRLQSLMCLELQKPNTILIISLFAGGFGVDRFLIGDTGIGVAKLLTLGGCGIWAIIDLFLIMDATREKNFEKLRATLLLQR